MNDYTPYYAAEEQPHLLRLRTKRRYVLLWFTTYRIAPVFVLLCLGIATPGLYASLSLAIFFSMYAIFFFAMLYLGVQKYTLWIVLEKGSITRHRSGLFHHQTETELLHPSDSMHIIKENSGRSMSWVFYLVKDHTKKQVLYIPIFISENITARNNLAEAFAQKCGIKVSILE